MDDTALNIIIDQIKNASLTIEQVNALNKCVFSVSPISQPVGFVRWVDINQVQPNSYNPNSVANKEMRLLYVSIKEDGYTQPIVTIWDEELEKYIIIDGFHRYYTAKSNEDILARNKGRVPIVVLDKDISQRMASTVRHNRARGEHSIDGMSNIVFSMLDAGMSDKDICNKMGLEAEELLKLKHLTGFSKLFENEEYSNAWHAKKQIQLKRKYGVLDQKM